MAGSIAEAGPRCLLLASASARDPQLNAPALRLNGLKPLLVVRRGRASRSLVRTKLQMAAAGAAGASQHQPPTVWESLCEAAESAAQEADVLRNSVSSHVQEAMGTSLESMKEFAANADISGKIHDATGIVNEKVEEFAFESAREASRLNTRLRLSEKMDEATLHARQFVEGLDCYFQVRQRIRQLHWELCYLLGLALRHLHQFKRTPFFPFATGALLLWMVLSGLLGHLFIWTIWTIPFLPVVARTMARAALIEGNCPSCGHHFIGPKKSKLSCRQCNEIVWRPRSKSASQSRPAESSRSEPLIVVDLNSDGSFQ